MWKLADVKVEIFFFLIRKTGHDAPLYSLFFLVKGIIVGEFSSQSTRGDFLIFILQGESIRIRDQRKA